MNRAIKTVRAILAAAILAWLVVELGGAGRAQQGDESRRFLEVRRRQLELQAARKQFERTTQLADMGLVSKNDVERDRNSVTTAQLNYQQAVLSLLDLQPRISVLSAVKTQTQDGRKFVRLVITNLTPTFDDTQFKLLNNFEGSDPIPDQLRTRTVNDIFVSLRDQGAAATADAAARSGNVTISLPYEVHIAQLGHGETRTLNYQLLRDVDSLAVALSYRNQVQEVPVQLQHASGGTDIQISSSQFSQEADLGSQATYNITLERPTVDVRSFQLKVVNLPQQISHSFIDLQSQARLSQINFPAGVTRQALGLRLFLPERADEKVRVDRPIEFWALALDQGEANRFTQDRRYEDREVSHLSGKARLVLSPRGVGKIEVLAMSLFSEAEGGQPVNAEMTVRNSGTRRLDNVRLTSEAPLNWRVEIEPDIIQSLEINREQIVKLNINPSSDVGVGDYEVRFKTESFADNKRVQSEDKIYRVNIKTKTNLAVTALLIGGLALLVTGVVIFSVKLTRR
ncbi:MAG: NEW3 domain-containing protein [Blastocatellia bacterium]